MPVATIFISRPRIGSTAGAVNRTGKSKRVILKQVEGNLRAISFPIGPLQVQYEGGGLEYVNIERPGRVALLEASEIKPKTISFEAVIANPDTAGQTSVEGFLALLQSIYVEDSDLIFTYGVRSLPFKVRLTNFSYNSARRDLNGNIQQAVANIQLTERPRRVIDPITLSAVRYEPPSKPRAKKKKKKGSGSGGRSSSSDNSGHVTVHDVNPPKYNDGGGGVREFS